MAQVGTAVTVIPSDATARLEPGVFAIHKVVISTGSDIVRMTIEVPDLAQASVQIFDARGRHVRAIVEEVLNPGSHNLTWNSRDSAGRRVASGVYFLKLSSKQRTATKKIVLMR